MGRLKRTLGPATPIAVALAVWLIAMATVLAHTTPAAVPQAAAAAPAQASGYVGEDTCLTCHEQQAYRGSAHAFKANARTPAATQGCESCHGPGQAHVEAGGDKTKIVNPKTVSPRDASETCLTCHNRSEHSGWDGSKHDSRNVSCVTCHSVHQPKSEKAGLKTATQQETCVQCHKTQVSKLHRSAHMPVREGKMECSSCHNPHGSQNVKMLKEGNSINESCASCHAEKRGPFLYEHAVGRENCVTCHDPHGSNNDRMLVAKQPMLCQKCHVHSRHPATIYDNTQVNVSKSNRIVGRSCVNCHQMIHGSNHPTSGKFFMR